MQKVPGAMKFFLIILLMVLAYYLLNWYIYQRFLMLFPFLKGYLTWYRVAFILLALSYPLGALLVRYTPQSFISIGIVWISSYWMGIQFYSFILFAVADTGLMLLRIAAGTQFPLTATLLIPQIAFLGIIGSILIYGHINSRNISVTRLALSSPRQQAVLDTIHIVIASDLHIGTIIHNSRVEKMVHAINSLKPDVLLLAGDILDGELPHDIHLSIEHLSRLHARYGVYAVPGNHEYIAGIDRSLKLIRQAGIIVLRDEARVIADSVTIIGRDDISGSRFGGKPRMELEQLLDGAPSGLPVLLADHQPYHLEKADNPRISLQVSGHTHNGQIYPFTHLVQAMYPLTWGYLHKQFTHFYVSCGLGTWGPPMRLGSKAEIVDITLTLQ